MSNDDVKALGWKLLPWLSNTVVALLIWWASQLNADLREAKTAIVGIKLWKAGVEASLYTAQDHASYAETQRDIATGLALKLSEQQKELAIGLADIRVALAQLPKKDDLPPQWFRDYVRTLDVRIDRLESVGARTRPDSAETGK